LSDTNFIPTNDFSVGGDYVVILALPTKIGLPNKSKKTIAARRFIDGGYPRPMSIRGLFVESVLLGAFLIARGSAIQGDGVRCVAGRPLRAGPRSGLGNLQFKTDWSIYRP
jgi:hypothetical protein